MRLFVLLFGFLFVTESLSAVPLETEGSFAAVQKSVERVTEREQATENVQKMRERKKLHSGRSSDPAWMTPSRSKRL